MRTLIGIDLGGTNVRAGRVEGLQVHAHAARAISGKAGAEQVLEEVMQTIAKVWTPAVEGIGIGLPGLIDVDQGIVRAVTNIPSLNGLPLKAILETRFSVPVQVNNDGNCFALGELHYGLGRGLRHLVGLVAGTGLGSGIIANGKLYCGANCGAGEIGSLPWREATLEDYVSGSRFRRLHGLEGAELGERARRGETEALAFFHSFGHDVAYALQLVLYAYDPEMVIFGGSCAKDYVFWKEGLREGLQSFAYPLSLARLRLEVTREPHIAILGAAALCLDAAL